MKFWTEELAQVEAAALRAEALEHEAEKRFDGVHAQGVTREQAVETPEFAAWMAARAETDAAWGRWAVVKDSSLEQEGKGRQQA